RDTVEASTPSVRAAAPTVRARQSARNSWTSSHCMNAMMTWKSAGSDASVQVVALGRRPHEETHDDRGSEEHPDGGRKRKHRAPPGSPLPHVAVRPERRAGGCG